MDRTQIKHVIEAALLAAGRPLPLDKIAGLFTARASDLDKETLLAVLEELGTDYSHRGLELKEVSSGYRIQIRSSMTDWLTPLWEERAPRYTRALLETLALIAYRQPITRAEIEEVRGVAVSTNITRTLLERNWIRVVGHRDVPGKPAMFGTTRDFLDYFGLKKLEDLPTLAEIKEGPPEESPQSDLIEALSSLSSEGAARNEAAEAVGTPETGDAAAAADSAEPEAGPEAAAAAAVLVVAHAALASDEPGEYGEDGADDGEDEDADDIDDDDAIDDDRDEDEDDRLAARDEHYAEDEQRLASEHYAEDEQHTGLEQYPDDEQHADDKDRVDTDQSFRREVGITDASPDDERVAYPGLDDTNALGPSEAIAQELLAQTEPHQTATREADTLTGTLGCDTFDSEAPDSDTFGSEAPDSDTFGSEAPDSDTFDSEASASDTFDPEARDSDTFDPEARDSDALDSEALDSNILGSDPLESDSLEADPLEADGLDEGDFDSDEDDAAPQLIRSESH
jgi:segregation and condensation protein B